MHDYINGEIIRKTFPDGEHYMQLLTDLEDKEVVLIGGTINDHDTLELYDIANGIIQLGARSLKMVIPYFGYATMERAVKVGEVVKAKTGLCYFLLFLMVRYRMRSILLIYMLKAFPIILKKKCDVIICIVNRLLSPHVMNYAGMILFWLLRMLAERNG